MNKVLVFQTWGIGDMIMSTPMISTLRQQLPEAYITVVAGSRAAADVVDGASFCNEIRIMSPDKMIFYQLIKTFHGFRRERFDAAIICTRVSPRIAQLLKLLSGIKVIAGDCLPPRRWGYTHWCPVKLDLHRVTSNLNILRMILPDATICPLYFHLDPGSLAHAYRFWRGLGLDGRDVLGIHPGAGYQQKNKLFPPEKFCLVIRMFLDKVPDARVVIFFGPDDQVLMPHFSGIDESVIFARDLTLRTVGAVISQTRVLLAGDSGLGHIAAALSVPVVTLAGPTQVVSTGPWGDRNIIVKTSENLPCMPCYDTNLYCHCDSVSCMKTISEVQVLESLSQYFLRV